MLKLVLHSTVTFSGEKLLGIFPQPSEFSRDFPQQLNDQCYVICTGKHYQQNSNTRQFNQHTACRHGHHLRRQKPSALSNESTGSAVWLDAGTRAQDTSEELMHR